MSKQSGDTGNSTHTLNGESWAVSGGKFLDAALNALRQAGSDQAEHLLARLEALGITGLTPDELEGLQALVSQTRNQGQLYAQAPSGVVSDANPQPPGLGAPGGAQNPAGNGEAGSQQSGAGGEAGVPPTGGTDAASPPPPPAPGATGVPRRNGVFGTGDVGDTNPLATGTGGLTPDGTGSGATLGGGTAAVAGLGGTALGGGLGGGGVGATGGSAPTGLSSDFGRLPSTLSGISLTSFNNFSFGNNATGSQGAGAGFTVSSSLGGATVTSSSDATAPFVQQSIGINGVLATQTTVSPLLTSVFTQNSNSVSGTVGQGTITVQTVAPRAEEPQPTATAPTQTPVVENPNGTVSVTAHQASVSEGTGETSQTLTFTVTRSNPLRGDTVPYTLSGVDAADLVDGAQALSGQVTFAAGQSSATITVAVVADQLVEQNENLGVILGSGSYATPVGGPAVTRIDNDDFATLTIAPVEAVVLEGDPDDDGGAYRTISYTITRVLPEGNTTLPADTIRWEVDSGAQGALDIARVPLAERSGSVSFAAGQTEATITVRVEKNYEVDADQNLVVKVLDSTMAHADANLGAVRYK